MAGLRFSLHVTVARREMELKDVLQLVEGSVIELGKRASDPVEVRVNGRLLGKRPGGSVRRSVRHQSDRTI